MVDFNCSIYVTKFGGKELTSNERSRVDSIDILKAICAFLIVCIHVPFPGNIGEYVTTLARIAVPIFFMITGYFYSGVVKKRSWSNKEDF